MTAICPAGPPKESAATRHQTTMAARKGTVARSTSSGTAGVAALVRGLVETQADDAARIEAAMPLFEGLWSALRGGAAA